MRPLVLILGDQLTPRVAALAATRDQEPLVLMAEVDAEATYVAHHPQKIALVFAAMRHFAAELRESGVAVRYMAIDDPDNPGDLGQAVALAQQELGGGPVHVTEPGEWRLAQEIAEWPQKLGIDLRIHTDDRFFCALPDFFEWSDNRRRLRMEDFYRSMRRRHQVLLAPGGGPIGGRWNFDADNRHPLPRDPGELPAPPRFSPDATTRQVLDTVAKRYSDHFGRLEPFNWAVTRGDAERARDYFIENALPLFGDYQDAMRRGAPWLYHSVLSPYLNLGLLEPHDLVRRAEAAAHSGHAPLNAVEGFIRQILGWREYVRGIYWRFMPEYAERNALAHERPLPAFYWTGDTDMACVREVVTTTHDHAYAHHIQRLMITGNFAMLAGIAPAEVCDWYLRVYADAYEWVELPNTLGMALYGDGGLLGSKPYAAGGGYIHRMSDYCRHCRYNVRSSTGPDACPFNALYWHFLMRHRERLADNHRMRLPYRTLGQMDSEHRQGLWKRGEELLANPDKL